MGSIEMPASGDQVLNKQQSISSRTSTTHAASPTTDSASQDITAETKRALLCGVTNSNSADPENRLKGSVNDVERIKEMLITHFGFPDNDECIRVLIEDDHPEINGKKPIPPTKKNIEDSLKWLVEVVEGSKSGHKLVFFFSGHCCRPQTHDHVCLVCTEGGLISNDYINSTIVRPLKKGDTLYAIVDACFSGSILDLKYKCEQKRSNILRRGTLIYLYVRDRLSIIGKFWLESCSTSTGATELAEGCWSWTDNQSDDLPKGEKDKSGGLAICLSATDNGETAESGATELAEGCWTDNQSDDLPKGEKDQSGGLAICLSATDNQETAESNANSGGNEILGAMTFNLTEMVKENPNLTYENILNKMQKLHVESCRNIERVPLGTMSRARSDYLKSRKIEVPLLSSSRKFKVSSMKFLL